MKKPTKITNVVDLHENINAYHDRGLWIPSRTIYLESSRLEGDDPELDFDTAAKFIKNLHILETLGDEEIRVYLNCPGGSDVDGMAIYDAIEASPCSTRAIVLGEAASMGAVILQAFTWRTATPYARFLLHNGTIELKGPVRDIERQVDAARLERIGMHQIFAHRTGKKASYWARKLQTDYLLNATEAKMENLIDEVL